MNPNARSDAPPVSERSGVSGADGVITLGQRIDRMCSAAEIAWNGGCAAIRELRGVLDIDGHVDRNPYRMMAAAVGSGYVLGGGLFTPLTARIVGLGLRLGLRVAAVPVIQRELLGIAEATLESDVNPTSSNEPIKATNAVNNRR